MLSALTILHSSEPSIFIPSMRIILVLLCNRLPDSYLAGSQEVREQEMDSLLVFSMELLLYIPLKTFLRAVEPSAYSAEALYLLELYHLAIIPLFQIIRECTDHGHKNRSKLHPNDNFSLLWERIIFSYPFNILLIHQNDLSSSYKDLVSFSVCLRHLQ